MWLRPDVARVKYSNIIYSWNHLFSTRNAAHEKKNARFGHVPEAAGRDMKTVGWHVSIKTGKRLFSVSAVLISNRFESILFYGISLDRVRGLFTSGQSPTGKILGGYVFR